VDERPQWTGSAEQGNHCTGSRRITLPAFRNPSNATRNVTGRQDLCVLVGGPTHRTARSKAVQRTCRGADPVGRTPAGQSPPSFLVSHPGISTSEKIAPAHNELPGEYRNQSDQSDCCLTAQAARALPVSYMLSLRHGRSNSTIPNNKEDTMIV